jgi:hypothetical protein
MRPFLTRTGLGGALKTSRKPRAPGARRRRFISGGSTTKNRFSKRHVDKPIRALGALNVEIRPIETGVLQAIDMMAAAGRKREEDVAVDCRLAFKDFEPVLVIKSCAALIKHKGVFKFTHERAPFTLR